VINDTFHKNSVDRINSESVKTIMRSLLFGTYKKLITRKQEYSPKYSCKMPNDSRYNNKLNISAITINLMDRGKQFNKELVVEKNLKNQMKSLTKAHKEAPEHSCFRSSYW
jgi:hypothetical protein